MPEASSQPTSKAGRPTRPSPSPIARLMPVLIIGGLFAGHYSWSYWQDQRPLRWSGTIESRTIEVGSRLGGRVREVQVREGDLVEAGSALVVFEAGKLLWQEKVARARLEEARAELALLERGARHEEIEQAKANVQVANSNLRRVRKAVRPGAIAAARATLRATEARLSKAAIDLVRTKKLVETGALPETELAQAQVDHEVALADRERASLELGELQRGDAREAVSQASAQVAVASASARLVQASARDEELRAAQARVAMAEGQLHGEIQYAREELTVRAPVSARIEALPLRPGDLVAPDATAAVLLELDELYLRIYVPETELGFIQPGQELEFIVDSFPDESFTGEVAHINHVGEFTPRNLQTIDERADQFFSARVNIRDERAALLRPGMAAFVRRPK